MWKRNRIRSRLISSKFDRLITHCFGSASPFANIPWRRPHNSKSLAQLSTSFENEGIGFKLSFFVFSILIFVLTLLTLATTVYSAASNYYLWYFWPIWGDIGINNLGWMYPYLAFFWLIATGFAMYFLLNRRGLNRKRLILIAFCLILASSGITHALWIALTPQSSFTVATDKPVYLYQEIVYITVTLKNTGYVPISFTPYQNPILSVAIELPGFGDLFSTPYLESNQTATIASNQTVTIAPGQNLTSTFVWNQEFSNGISVGPGTYVAYSFSPWGEPFLTPDQWSSASATFNIT